MTGITMDDGPYALRRSLDLRLLESTALFDADWYLARNADVAVAGLDPRRHYLEHGAAEGRSPGPRFDAQRYLTRHASDPRARANPLIHFLRQGLPDLKVDQPRELLSRLQGLGVFLSGEPAPAAAAPREGFGRTAVFVSHDAQVGGAPTVLASIASWFRRHTNYQVRIVTMGGGPWVNRFMDIAPTFVVGQVKVSEDRVAERREALRRFLGEEPAFTFINSVAAGDYCRIDPFTAPRLAYLHELPKVIELFTDQMELLRRHAEHFLCDGSRVAEALRTTYGIAEDRLSVRECFIDPAAEPPPMTAQDKAAARAAMGWSSETKIVMGCGIVHWRKQPELFVRAAARIAGDVRFVWIGGGPDVDQVKALAAELGVADRVEILGHRDDHRDLLRAADVFALPSVEDPFPLVCLDAGAASAPSVIFREAGGMWSYVEPEGRPPAGIAVTLGDDEAYIAALEALLVDDNRRAALGRTARERVLAEYTAASGCLHILRTIRAVAKLPPLVSVVVPVYNSRDFLDERLRSIAEQTFKDVEIVLRDDCSADDSLEVLRDFARGHPLARVEAAEVNGGSVFRAWARCIEAAQGELVWLAEADDACEPDFLDRMVDAFRTSGVRLAYGQSRPVNRAGAVMGDYATSYLKEVAPGHWGEAHCLPARREVNLALGRRNTIPNASAVVVRRSVARRIAPMVEDFRIAGDWAFYVAAIHGGRVAYVPEAINYHRRHDQTVTHALEGGDAYFEELASVGSLVRHLFGPDADRDAAFAAMMAGELDRFGRAGRPIVGVLPRHAPEPGLPGVLYGVGDLAGGGAQMFALRFCNGWVERGAAAVLLNVGYQADHPSVRQALAPEVPVVTQGEVMAAGLQAFLDDWGLEVVVTGHWWADRAVGRLYATAVPAPRAPWIIVMHGCYESVLDSPQSFPDRAEALAAAEAHCALWVWTADKNRRLFDEAHVRPKATRNILNGFEPVAGRGLARASLGIPEEAVVFTLASRAIESKGWLVTRDAFQALLDERGDGPPVHLLLIGDGPAAAQIAAGPLPPEVHLVGHTSRLVDYIGLSDVGLLPSWFDGESLPLVVLEFLAQGKPVIVSDIGFCPRAIDAGPELGPAGRVVPRDAATGQVRVEDVVDAMRAFVVDRSRARALDPVARQAFEKFSFSRMVAEYRDAMGEVLARTATPS